MKCQRCGSSYFEEENGLYYCGFCQTQSQGFTQEIGDKYIERTFTKEVKEKHKFKKKIDRKTGVLWTTTEAFNIILNKQLTQILEIEDINIEEESMKTMVSLIWFSYLRASDIAFRDDETHETCSPALHPASRFRDQQIFKNKVNNCLPKYKNGNSKLGFTDCMRLGSDGVVRVAKDSDLFKHFEYIKNDIETNYDLNDVYYDKYNDPRIYAKRKENEIKISKESRKQLRQLLSKIDLQTSFYNTLDLLAICNDVSERETDSDVIDSDIDKNIDKSIAERQSISDDSNSETKERECDDLNDWFESDDNYDDYDKELMRNLTKTTKIFSKFIPLSYLKKSNNIGSNYFIDFMSLPKTLAILNIAFRLLNCNIYGFDLIRWSSEGHIPYLNCLTCFPEDWEIISNDYHTFTSSCTPSTKTLNILSAKIAKHIKINSFPRPNLKVLLKRFVKDLNLPKSIVKIIQNDYNLFSHFPNKLEKTTKNCRIMNCLPFYERWALMAIVMLLKRIFVLDDTTERRLSECAKNHQNLFIWDEWEKYTRLRFQLIKSYTPLYGRNLEDIRDVDVIVSHSLQRNEYESEKTIYTERKAQFKEYDFRYDVQKDFQQYLGNESELLFTQLPTASLYPLTNATNFALTRIDSSSIESQLSVNFENKFITPWICSHGNTFHRGYKSLDIGNALRPNDIRNWSSSFKLLIELSSIVLHCRYQDLLVIINQMEKIYFGESKVVNS